MVWSHVLHCGSSQDLYKVCSNWFFPWLAWPLLAPGRKQTPPIGFHLLPGSRDQHWHSCTRAGKLDHQAGMNGAVLTGLLIAAGSFHSRPDRQSLQPKVGSSSHHRALPPPAAWPCCGPVPSKGLLVLCPVIVSALCLLARVSQCNSNTVFLWSLHSLFWRNSTRSSHFFGFCIFVLIVWMCPTPYLMISNTFNKQNLKIILIIQTGDWKFASGDYISPVSRQKAT